MKYLTRHLERKFLKMNDFFKVLMITGARQVGKTTMLRHLARDENRTYVSLDNMQARDLAKSDPVLFFQTYPPPILIDEVQYAPELFSRIKVMCDESDKTGQFWLTGSQKFDVMKNVRETLVGRIGILELFSLSQNEKNQVNFDEELDFSFSCLKSREAVAPKNDIVSVFSHIWQGGMPTVLNADDEMRQEYFNSYVMTYLMGDAKELGGISDSIRFSKFLSACAALISRQVNYKTLADAAEVSQPTAKQWLSLLQGMDIVYLLQPYSNNEMKRLSKTPKLYFCDTGLAAHLSMWPSQNTLMAGAASGHYFENYVVIELLKNYAYAQTKANLMYFRDSNAREIDLFVERGTAIHPLEIKKSANPNRREIKKFSVLDSVSVSRSNGGIICMCEEVIPIDADNCFIPCNLL